MNQIFEPIEYFEIPDGTLLSPFLNPKYAINHGDALVRTIVTYAFADGFEVLGGANIFLGDTGRFGQYTDNDMMYMKVKYSF